MDPGLLYASTGTSGEYSPVPLQDTMGPVYIPDIRSFDLTIGENQKEGFDGSPGHVNLIPSYIPIQNPLPPTTSCQSAISPSFNSANIHDFTVPYENTGVPSSTIGISTSYHLQASNQTNYNVANLIYPLLPSYPAQPGEKDQITPHFDSSPDTAHPYSGEGASSIAVDHLITSPIATPSDNISREEAIEIARQIEGFYVTGIFETGLKTDYTNDGKLVMVWDVRVLATKEKPVPGEWSSSYLYGVVIDAQSGEILRIDPYYGTTMKR